MGKKSKIRPTDFKYKSKFIKPTEVDDTQKVSFNFKHLHSKRNKFQYEQSSAIYFNVLLGRLREISKMTRKEMIISNKKPLKCHQINFHDVGVTENSFGNLGEDMGDDPWQFCLTVNKHGRVHGFFVRNIFFIVWLDRLHELYSKA